MQNDGSVSWRIEWWKWLRQSKEKRMERNEDILRHLWDKIKHNNIWIIGAQKKKDKRKGHGKIFQEILVENFPKMEKEIATQVQESQRVPYRIKPRKSMPKPYINQTKEN